jgi:phage terminase large subunit-like protein
MASRRAIEGQVPEIEVNGEKFPDYPGMAAWYCQRVVDGRVPACSLEVLACKRYLEMLADVGHEYVFSVEACVDVCSFIENLRHVKGFDGNIVLEPVQCWWLCGIFGFRDRDTGLRFVRQVSLYVPRKNGKSLLSAGIALFCANCEGEIGAEVIISAGSEEQARKVFTPIKEMIERDDDLREAFLAKTTTSEIRFRETGATIATVASLAKNIDGFNPHVVIAEELHAQKQEVIGVLSTAQGARQMPLFHSISTAGRFADGPAFDDWKQCVAVLQGMMKVPRLFCVVYTPDPEDEAKYFDNHVVEKCNPLWGISLNPVSIQKEARDALKSEADLNEYKRTRLNIWSRAAGNLFNREKWEACSDPKLSLARFKGFPMYVGIDLASRSDLAAACFMICVGGTVYIVGRYWIGRNVPRLRDGRYADAFLAWAREGHITLTTAHDGTFIDFKAILKEVLAMIEGHDVRGIGLDDYQANHIASDFEEAGYPTFIVQKNARSLTPSTDDLVARHENPDLLQHDGNPITAWCAGNVVGYYDSVGNVLPKKDAGNSRASIDGMDAAIVANALRLDDEAGVLGLDSKAKKDFNPYLARGLAGASDGPRPH